MEYSLNDIKDIVNIITSIITTLSIIVGGVWVFWRFILQQEKYPNINFTADINIIGRQGDSWIVELLSFVDNKGKAQHKMEEFNFELSSINTNEIISTNDQWGGQVDFQHLVTKGSFLPTRYPFFFVDPGTNAKYSFITKVPVEATFLILHSTFKYFKRNNYGHTAEKTLKLPNLMNENNTTDNEHAN